MNYKFLANSTKTKLEFEQFLTIWNNTSIEVRQQSSGSTGPPKIINIPKSKMIASAQMTGSFFELNKLSKSLLCISPNYIGGKMMIVRSILYDLEIVLTEISSNPLKHLNEKIDFAAMVPLQVDTILKENPEKLNLIKYLIIGGAPVSLELEARLQNSSCIAYSTYGMTETISHVALKKLDTNNTPFIGVGATTFEEKNGELIINCPPLGIKGLHTTDIVELIDKHSFYWKGRKDFVINSGGVKIHPELVEQKIKNELHEDKFIISSISDVTFGEKIIIICERSVYDKVSRIIEEWHFEKYEKPKDIYIVDKLVLTNNGKIDRIATRSKIIHD